MVKFLNDKNSLCVRRRLKSESGIILVEVSSDVCTEDSCKAKTRTGADIWQDADHLSINGSIEIADVIAREVSLLVK